MSGCPKCKSSTCVGFNPENRKCMCHHCLHEWFDAPVPGSPPMTTLDIAGLVQRAKSWDRCYPGNLNVEMLVDDLTSALEHLAGEVERLAAELNRIRWAETTLRGFPPNTVVHEGTMALWAREALGIPPPTVAEVEAHHFSRAALGDTPAGLEK